MLEFLRDTEIIGPKGNKGRLLDEVDGVSGGSFTALAYRLYGDKLFVDYEQRFLKRDVQGEIISRTLSPANWGKLTGTAWGRSELAAELYDEILFDNATFGDLNSAYLGGVAFTAARDCGRYYAARDRLSADLCVSMGPRYDVRRPAELACAYVKR